MTEIVICDDSSFARKQVARAFPQAWDSDISFACNGEEAMQYLREGSCEILILDLNMPVMDGYEVLEAILVEDIECNVVVVSGDIQPEAQKRVMDLGALAFIKKPVASQELIDTFVDLDIIFDTGQTAREVDMVIDALDGYKEIANVAVGRASDMMARYLEVFVKMPIPHVSMVEASELAMILSQSDKGDDVTIVCQGFIGAGIAGEGILIVNNSDADEIAELLKYEGERDDLVNQELLLEIASMFINASMQGVAEQLDIIFSMGTPVVMGDFLHASRLIEDNAGRWKDILAIEMESKIEGKDISCNLLLLFTGDSLKALNNLIGYL